MKNADVRPCFIVHWKSYLQPLGSGGAIKSWEEKDELLNELLNKSVTEVFVEQPLLFRGMLIMFSFCLTWTKHM